VEGERATLLRLGGLARADLEAVAGPLLSPDAQAFAAPASPGMLLRHYAPNAPVRLGASKAHAGEILIGFGPDFPADGFNLSPTGNLTEAAANLFAMLRLADAQSPTAIAVAPIPNWGLGEAIVERLTRASAR
jgi:L-threonylcarbamoyladenylate synthase